MIFYCQIFVIWFEALYTDWCKTIGGEKGPLNSACFEILRGKKRAPKGFYIFFAYLLRPGVFAQSIPPSFSVFRHNHSLWTVIDFVFYYGTKEGGRENYVQV